MHRVRPINILHRAILNSHSSNLQNKVQLFSNLSVPGNYLEGSLKQIAEPSPVSDLVDGKWCSRICISKQFPDTSGWSTNFENNWSSEINPVSKQFGVCETFWEEECPKQNPRKNHPLWNIQSTVLDRLYLFIYCSLRKKLRSGSRSVSLWSFYKRVPFRDKMVV